MYADVQMFMGKLQQLINCNDNELINNQSILCERPQFQLLYEALGSMIQTLFNHEDQDLHNFEEMKKLKKRFKAAAEEAEDIVDIFLSAVHCRNNRYSPISNVFQPYLHLEVVMRSIDSIKMEFMTMRMDNMKMDASQRTDRLQMQSSGTSRSRNSIGSKKVKEEMVVGFDRDAEIIRDKLAEDGKHLDVISIVGMGGIGKSTLANKVFYDPFVVYHFHIRGWVTVSQTYDKRDLLIQVLSSIDDGLELEEATDSQLHQILHRSLYCKRYLIVIDDTWSTQTWDKLKLFFPDHNNGSRHLLTNRLTEVAWHAKLHGLIHHLQHLTEEESWKLLCEKVFKGDECPKWLIKPGKQITKNCHGLPLSVVVMAGVLAKEPRHKDVWLKISYSVHSYMASDEKGCLETIALSYHHLPLHLRDCFLYLGGFPEDYKIHSPWLLWVWMAEGFIQEDGNQSLEEIAKGYLVDLVDRNLVIVQKRYLSGDIRRCKVHDLVRQLSVEKKKDSS
ncbi:putative late blight resistance protein homolog R1A-10 [Lactuca sativa]|uniref:putative late blight resistance protein homolog R1A-10 n=1 Tax=Lactuca sativa TaxID=4236 RepID=UPI000CC4AF42|nr:putative late blight resistance protein homolog R1A-10 [Lactuca sativa]